MERLRRLCTQFTHRVLPDAPMSVDTVLLAASVALLPLFYLTVKNWAEAWLVILGVVSVYGFWKAGAGWKTYFPDQQTAWIFCALCAPLAGNFISIVFRGDLRWDRVHADLDFLNGPSRCVIAAIAFLWMRSRCIRFTDVLSGILPLSVIICLFFATYQDQPNRYCTRLIDVDQFAQQICLLGSLVFLLIVLKPLKGYALAIFNLAAIASAAHMAIATQGRGGWIALPILLIITPILYRGSKLKLMAAILSLLLCLSALLVASTPLRSRVLSIYTDATQWHSGANQFTSGGTRLTMWKISWELIRKKPMAGYGSQKMLWQPVYSMDESIYHPPAGGYAGKGEDPRETLCNIGPHNQLFSDLLHGGLLVMIPTLLLLFAPLTIFCINVYSRSARVHLACSLGIVLTLYFAVFCLSHSPFGLKLFWSFYGFMIAALSAQVLSAQDEKNPLKHPEPSKA